MDDTDLAIAAPARARTETLNDETVTITPGGTTPRLGTDKISPDDGFGTADAQLVCNGTVFSLVAGLT
jgi:hypothetical protein